MTDGYTRRALLGRAGSGLIIAGAVETGAAAQSMAADQSTVRASAPGPRLLNVVALGADPTGQRDSAPALQQAIDEIARTGGTVYIPAGRYRIGRTLLWQNPNNARAPGITLQGDGMHSTVLVSAMEAGPIFKVRGVPAVGPINTTFFWGGGIRDLSFHGDGGRGDQHGLEILGWYYGEIQNCQFLGFGGDGIRALVDLDVYPNPDYTSSTMLLRGVWFERLGGYGFRDMSRVQGAPSWSWSHCVFNMCRAGCALVRSGGLEFRKCTFTGAGWQDERGRPAARAYGLYFDGAATTSAQNLVEGCEFDTNLTAHIGARFLTASSFLDNRFIFNDLHRSGRLRPPIGVEIGSGDSDATVLGVQFRQSFFRFDLPGDAIAFDFANSANVRDIEIGGTVFTEPRGTNVTRYRGHDPAGQGAAFGYAIRDRPRE